MKVCSTKDCMDKHYALGLCQKHYAIKHRIDNADRYNEQHANHLNTRVGAGLVDTSHHSSKQIVTYVTAHRRVAYARGRASEYICVDCGNNANQWALMHSAENIIWGTNNGKPRRYSLDINDYQPMCAKCHVVYDRDDSNEPSKARRAR